MMNVCMYGGEKEGAEAGYQASKRRSRLEGGREGDSEGIQVTVELRRRPLGHPCTGPLS